MSPFFKKTHIRFSPEITAGLCPHCDMQASFISIVNDQYRCMTCGEDVKQEINGVIKLRTRVFLCATPRLGND